MANNLVALINLKGPIVDTDDSGGFGAKTELNFGSVRQVIEQAFSLPRLLAVVVAISSPGGSPSQTNLIAKHLRTTADEKKIKLYAVVEDMAASGGYWLACAADEIYLDPNRCKQICNLSPLSFHHMLCY